ncbi:sensor histidine kinase [Actinoplanes xinjiangensis]|uniref:sensor histidine kinase n=1 Tax=Actinoplanes xinjiangensis TaxID=512350 RepID=UPI00342E79AB
MTRSASPQTTGSTAEVPDVFGFTALARDARPEPPAHRDIIRTAGHELRTPLNGILGIVGVLRRQLDRPVDANRQRSHLDLIEANATALVQTIDDLLILGRYQPGQAVTLDESVHVREILRASAQSWRQTADERHLRLSLTDGPDAVVRSDPRLLRQILDRLVANAVRYTAEGAVELSVHPTTSEGSARIEIRDTGPGIPTSERARMFAPFVRGTAGTSDASASAGLGLTVVARLAALLRLTVDITDNHPLRGTCFTLTFDAPALAGRSA